MSDNQKWSILQGDALKVLGTFAPNTFDAVITDPPYASGGRTQTEKNKSTARKYSSMGENAPPPFDGDAKDQRSWTVPYGGIESIRVQRFKFLVFRLG